MGIDFLWNIIKKKSGMCNVISHATGSVLTMINGAMETGSVY